MFSSLNSIRSTNVALHITDECMSTSTCTEPLNYTTNFNIPLLIHIVVCSAVINYKNLIEMSTIKNNKNIAIYMGGKTSNKSGVPIGHQNIWIPIHGVCRWDTVDVGKGKILRYHKSWDWLIPVIDKIKSDDMYTKYVDYSSSMIDEGGVHINTKFINVTYDNVIDFIDWYNEQ